MPLELSEIATSPGHKMKKIGNIIVKTSDSIALILLSGGGIGLMATLSSTPSEIEKTVGGASMLATIVGGSWMAIRSLLKKQNNTPYSGDINGNTTGRIIPAGHLGAYMRAQKRNALGRDLTPEEAQEIGEKYDEE